MDYPTFVVVGNVNQGKSSVVAALSENTGIPIDSYPGTTRRAGAYVFKSGDRELFRLIDTPGFQQPRQVLRWLRERATTASARPAAVRAFVDAHADTEAFRDEVELLRPILDGAGILYVVDASSHLEPSNEAEMEILRWTGQPAMALLNRVRDRDHAEEWRPTLRQFFHIVRDFDAHAARFADRVGLLRGFREIRPEWGAAIDAAVGAMESESLRRNRLAAGAVADLMVAALSHVERRPLAEGDDESRVRAALESAFRDAQRGLERRAREDVERVYGHPPLRGDEPDAELLAGDLFAEATWEAFGLSRTQLLQVGAVSGAAVGVLADLGFGGMSLGAATALGAGLGAAAAWLGGQGLAKVRTGGAADWKGRLLPFLGTGTFLTMGPVRNQRYAWVLLDRALVHARAVRDRSHACRATLAVRAARVSDLPEDLRARLAKDLGAIVAEAHAGVRAETRDRFATSLDAALSS
jgi:small GTP-binding protein